MLRRLSFLFIMGIALFSIPMIAAQTENPPQQVSAALAAFNNYLTQPIRIDQLDSYQVTQGTYTDTALGCTLVAGAPVAAPVTAFKVQLIYQSIMYEFEVSADMALIIPCSPALIAAQPALIQIPTTPQAMMGMTGCPVDFAGYLPPRLTIGGFARIGAEGQPNRMRAAPSIDAEQVGLINPGTTVEVLDGPVCEAATNIIWWQVRDGSLVGYTAEGFEADYFLEAVEVGALPILPAVREPITANNASRVVALATIPFEGGATVDFGGTAQLLVAGTAGVTFYDLDAQTVGNLPLQPDTSVLHVNYSPDSRYIAYSTEFNALFVYDIVEDDTYQFDIEDGTFINDLDFNPDNLLAVAIGDPLGGQESGNGWSLYSLFDNSRLLQYPTESWVGDVAFGPAGTRLAWLTDTINMALLQDDLPVVSGQIEQPTRTGLAWLPVEDTTDPNAMYQLAYADGNVIVLFDVTTSQLSSYTNEPDYLPGTLAFNEDGSVIAVLNRAVSDEPTPRALKLFDVASSDVLFSETLETARGMTFSPDGTLVVVLTDTTLRFYGIASFEDAVG
ncbi:MAG: SH3 domain-containing protein [Chloroflexota bacterium]|nr:SH3 domain-containing protein [Chloroflexota bacterium]